MVSQPAAVPRMSSSESLYLDLVRAAASFFVVLDHVPTLFDMPELPRWGHQAVVVFFVLSGYVISHVADTREPTAAAFLVARFSRLWSVLVPAMVLTVVCDLAGRKFGIYPVVYHGAPADLPFVRVGAVLVFLSESWVSIQPLSNGVVWSLCVEFWYYMPFAVWTFMPAGHARALVLVVVALLSGFKALLLLPIWLMGVALQRWQGPRRLSSTIMLVVWLTSTAIVALVLFGHLYDLPIVAMAANVSPWIFRQLAQSRVFWFDWVFGLAVAASLLGARTVAASLPLRRIAPVIRWCAGISFAAYLFHMPLLYFWASFLNRSQGWLAIALTLIVIGLLGPAAERSKKWWQRTLSALATQSLRRMT
jgi:peptidoglycan/LPS O-acetylase OafA/YrhL